jgi:hypothetical protein
MNTVINEFDLSDADFGAFLADIPSLPYKKLAKKLTALLQPVIAGQHDYDYAHIVQLKNGSFLFALANPASHRLAKADDHINSKTGVYATRCVSRHLADTRNRILERMRRAV